MNVALTSWVRTKVCGLAVGSGLVIKAVVMRRGVEEVAGRLQIGRLTNGVVILSLVRYSRWITGHDVPTWDLLIDFASKMLAWISERQKEPCRVIES